METNQIFDIKRFWLILKRDIFVNLKTYLIVLFVVFSVFFVKYFFQLFVSLFSVMPIIVTKSDLKSTYFFGFYIVGIIISGTAFGDFRNKLSTMTYLTLPASKLEKFFSVWLITTIGVIVAYFFSFVVFNLLLMLLGLFFKVDIPFFNIFTYRVFYILLVYFFIHSIFFAGAATFEKSPILKTPLIALLIQIIFSIVNGLIFVLIFLNYGLNFHIDPSNTSYFDLVIVMGKVLLYVTPFVFWIFTYFKLSEKQV